jgi:N-acetylglucosaminyldiphosphoundecaprenol N-acetyl-beta-D-mannosaminyltransferase
MNFHVRAEAEGLATAPAATAFAAVHDIPVTWLGGLPIAVIDRARSAEFMINAAIARRGVGGRPLYITSANGQVLSMCANEEETRALFAAADVIHADGTPLVFVSRLVSGHALPERVATTDLFHDVAPRAEHAGASFYLLGATTEVIRRAVDRTRERYPRLRIAGYRGGYFTPDEEAQVVAGINAAQPDILWVGMGVPIEQRFCIRHHADLNQVGVIKTSGGLFDFVSGKSRRAPAWMQSAGLEWAYRMVLEPRRLAYRYFTTNPHALYLLLTASGQPKP